MLTVLDAMDLATALDAELSMELSNATEVDAAEAYSDLFFYQQAHEAALGVTLRPGPICCSIGCSPAAVTVGLSSGSAPSKHASTSSLPEPKKMEKNTGCG